MGEPRVYEVEFTQDVLIVSRLGDIEQPDTNDEIYNNEESISSDILAPLLCGWCGFSTSFLRTLFVHQLLACGTLDFKAFKSVNTRKKLKIPYNVPQLNQNFKPTKSTRLTKPGITKIRKSVAQRSREYRQRQRLKNPLVKKIPKSVAQRSREYRERQKLKNPNKKSNVKTMTQLRKSIKNTKYYQRKISKKQIEQNQIISTEQERYLLQKQNSPDNHFIYLESFYECYSNKQLNY